MRFIFLLLGVFAFAQTAAAQAPPVEAFGRLPAVSDAAISPDGARLALAYRPAGQSLVRVVDLDRGEGVLSAAIGEESTLHDVGWVDEQRISYLIRRTFRPDQVLPNGVRFAGAPRRVDFYRYGVVDVATRRAQLLTTNENNPWQDQGASLIAPIEGDPGFRAHDRARAWHRNPP